VFELPLFPLHTVLFPGMPLELHIFEPRYRLMVQRCLESDQPFGVVLIRQGPEAGGPLAQTHAIGCSARIAQADPLPEERYSLVVVGDERFRIHKLDRSQPYLIGKVESLMLEHPCGIELSRGARQLNQLIHRYIQRLETLADEAGHLKDIPLPDDALPLMYLAAALLHIPNSEKQPLLDAGNGGDLMHRLLRLYQRENALLTRQPDWDEERHRLMAWLN
jgi:Lon protease-like protein